MIKRLSALFLLLSCCNIFVSAQSINASIFAKTGRFNTCGVIPILTATYVSGTGSSVVNGTLVCLDPEGSTTINILLSNLTWDQSPTQNWIHGLFFSNNAGVTINSTSLLPPPAGWIFMPGGCTGACPTGGSISGGPGFYFSGPGQSCCPGGESTTTPCDNYGDPTLNCAHSFSIGYQITIRNSILVDGQYALRISASSDGGTGCWNIGDHIISTITFSISTSKCNPVETQLCNPAGSSTLTTSVAGPYQWQMSSDSIQYTPISDNTVYAGTNTNTLTLTNVPSSYYGYRFKCSPQSKIYTLKFVNTWTGAVDTDWGNPGNWSCGAVPDGNTDVIVNSGTVIVSANTSVRSLTLQPGVVFTVNSGVTFTITH